MKEDTMRSYLMVEDVMALLSIKRTMAYKVIRDLNGELEREGFMTLRGRVPREYLLERFKIPKK